MINLISKPILKELKEFDLFFKESLDSKVKIINTVIRYIIKNKGKRYRPILCILCSKLTGKESNELTYLSASTVEILHVATLLHDDVVDDATLRRGWPTINKIWKNKLSILVGDYMFSRSLKNISKHNSLESINILADVSERLSEGEIFQIQKAMTKQMDEDNYYKMIGDKTASLISASCLLGLSSNCQDSRLKKSISLFGEYLGIAYQIKDDLFDIVGNIGETGKNGHLDLKKNMLTLPYINMLSKLDDKNKSALLRKIKYHIKRNELNELKTMIYESGAIDYTNMKIKYYSDLALNELNNFNSSDSLDALKEAVHFNIDRIK